MASKLINFVEAMHLMEILQKYPMEIVDNTPVISYIDGLLEVISPEDYLRVLELLGIDYKKVEKEDLVKVLILSIRDNQVSKLISYFTSQRVVNVTK